MATQTTDEARCETNRAFINVQRMHDGGRTKSLHDAATQTTANARMRDSACPKFRKDAKPKEQARRARMHDSGRTESAQGRTDPNDRNSTTPLHFRRLNKRGIIFGAGGENSHCAGRARMPISNNLYNFSSNVLTNYNNILQNPFKFVILYQKTKRPITS